MVGLLVLALAAVLLASATGRGVLGMVLLLVPPIMSTPVKFAIGLLGIGGSFAIMAVAGAAATNGPISPLWLLCVYLVQTLAELFLAPIGLSVTTKLAPTRFASQLMGLWFLATATGNALGGYVVRLNGQVSDAVYYGLLGGVAGLAGVVFLLSAPRIRKLMAGVA